MKDRALAVLFGFVLGALVVLICWGSFRVFYSAYSEPLKNKVVVLDQFREGIYACLDPARGDAYVGTTVEDNRMLFAQCLDDYRER